MTSLENWPRAGSMRSGRLYVRATLERPTSAVASSSSEFEAPYPTPSVTRYGSSGNGTGNNTASRGRPSLDVIAKKGMWATPLRKDAESGQVSDATFGKHRRGPLLTEMAARWPTPARTDAKDSARGTTTTGVMHPGTSLTDAMRGHPLPETSTDGHDTMVLVPEFVEALMGFPEGWTHVDAELVLLAWVTQLARSKRLTHLRVSSPGLSDADEDPETAP